MKNDDLIAHIGYAHNAFMVWHNRRFKISMALENKDISPSYKKRCLMIIFVLTMRIERIQSGFAQLIKDIHESNKELQSQIQSP